MVDETAGLARVGARLSGLWQALTRPHPSIIDIEQKRQAYLFAGLIVVLLLTTSLASLLLIAESKSGIPDYVLLAWFALVFAFGCYLANRRGWYRPSAWAFVAFNFALAHFSPFFGGDLVWVGFACMALILSAIFLSMQATTLVFLGSFVIQVALAAARPSTTTLTNIDFLTIFVVTAPLILVFMSHRSILENERQAELQRANSQLRQSEAELKQRAEERIQAENEARRRMEHMAAVGDLAIECATAATDAGFLHSIAEKLRAITGAVAVSISTYDPEERELTSRYIAASSRILSGVSNLVGRDMVGLRFPVSPDMLRRMMTEVVSTVEDLSDVSFGVIPKPVAAIVKKTLGISGFTGLALQHTGELVGTAVIAMPNDKPPLPLDLAETLTHVLSVALQRKSAEDALRQSEERFRDVFENAPIGIYQTTRGGRVLMANSTLVRMLGYASFEELAQRNIEKEAGSADYSRSDFKRRIERDGQISGLEASWIKKDGSTLYVRESARAMRDDLGNIWCYEGTAEDISERVRAERLLQTLNQAALAIQGALVPEEIFAALAEEFKKLGFSCVILLLDESQRELITRYVAFDAEAVEAAETLTDLEHTVFSIPIEDTDVYKKVVWGKQTVYVEDTEAVARQALPQPARQWAGRITQLLSIPRAIAAPLIVDDRAIGVLSVHSGELTPDDAPAITAFAHQLAAAWRKAQLFEQVQSELSERKRAEQEIRQRSRELALLNRIIAVSATVWGAETVLETACCELAQFFDVPYATTMLLNREKGTAHVVSEHRREGWPAAADGTIAVDEDFAFEYLLRQRLPVAIPDTGSRPAVDPTDARLDAWLHDLRQRGVASLLCLPLIIEGDVVGALCLESVEVRCFSPEEIRLAWSVAEQVAAALARIRLEEGHRRLSTAIEQAAESVMITDTEGTILYVNPAFERLTGYSRVEAEGQNARLLKSGRHDVDFYDELWTTVKAAGVWHGRMVNRNKNGDFFTVDTTITPVRDESGRVVNYVGVQRDVTRELQLEEQYRQAQKMEAIGLLAGGIAHDFNNLLTAINGFAELAQLEIASDDPAQSLVSKILNAGRRAADLVSQLLAFSRKQIVQPQMLNLNQVVTDMNKLLQRVIGEDIQLQTVLAPDLELVKADRTQVEQIVMNLAVNARDAMPGGGRLVIETANVLLDEGYVANHVGVHSGEYAQLVISDTGVGMSPEVRARIFEPFFTTKEMGRGTGLGLSTVYGIVQQSGGHIGVYSEEGQGTVFRIYLPRAAEDTTLPQSAAEQVVAIPQGRETILVVEDDATVQELATRALQKHGYSVLTASNGQDALHLAQDYLGEIQLVLTDVIMPGMNGKQLAEQLKQMRPGLKALFMSGYTDRVITAHGVLGPGVPYIQKPFSPADLARKVRLALDS